MNLQGVMLSEISQTEKDKHYMISTYVWNLKHKTCSHITKQKPSYRYREQDNNQMIARGKEGGRRRELNEGD